MAAVARISPIDLNDKLFYSGSLLFYLNCYIRKYLHTHNIFYDSNYTYCVHYSRVINWFYRIKLNYFLGLFGSQYIWRFSQSQPAYINWWLAFYILIIFNKGIWGLNNTFQGDICIILFYRKWISYKGNWDFKLNIWCFYSTRIGFAF